MPGLHSLVVPGTMSSAWHSASTEVYISELFNWEYMKQKRCVCQVCHASQVANVYRNVSLQLQCALLVGEHRQGVTCEAKISWVKNL